MSTSDYKFMLGGNDIVRSIIENDGVISAEELLQPASLPMTACIFEQFEQRIWLLSLKTRQGAIQKGHHYFLDAITQRGQVSIRNTRGEIVPGLFPMDYFVQMVANRVKVAPLPFDQTPGGTHEPVEPTSGQDPKQKGRR